MGNDKSQEVPNILKRVAGLLGTEIKNRTPEIPEKFGPP